MSVSTQVDGGGSYLDHVGGVQRYPTVILAHSSIAADGAGSG